MSRNQWLGVGVGGWKCTRQNTKPKADCEKLVKLTGLVRLIKGKQRGHNFIPPKMMP